MPMLEFGSLPHIPFLPHSSFFLLLNSPQLRLLRSDQTRPSPIPLHASDAALAGSAGAQVQLLTLVLGAQGTSLCTCPCGYQPPLCLAAQLLSEQDSNSLRQGVRTFDTYLSPSSPLSPPTAPLPRDSIWAWFSTPYIPFVWCNLPAWSARQTSAEARELASIWT